MAKDVKMSYIEDDIQKVQVKTNLYLQSYGKMGTFHLAKEVIQNSIDELIDPNCNGYRIGIMYNKLDGKLTVEDEGRGIPEEDYPIDVICTKLQSGSKFFRAQGGKSSGEFGIGLVVVLALAKFFSLTTYRNEYYHKVVFKNGKKVDDIKKKITKNDKKHGTVVEFIPNSQYLGKDCELPFDIMCDWLDDMKYQLPEGIKIKVTEMEGLEVLNEIKYKAKPFSKYINKLLGENKPISDSIGISGDRTIVEDVRESVISDSSEVKIKKKKMKKDVHLDVCFAYQDDGASIYTSFCNFTKTEDGGVHVDAVEEVLCRFLQNKTKASMTEKEKEKWDITWNDVKEGLKLAINLSTNAQVQFMGNAKNKIRNDELKPFIKEILQEGLENDFQKEQGKYDTICKFIKTNARARIEANKIKQVTKKERMGKFDDVDLKKYVPCNSTVRNAPRELYIVEGEKSAMGSVVNGRFSPDLQAVFGLRGVTKNPYKATFAEVMENPECKYLVKVMRCGIGTNFNLANLYFDKIILFADADIDGFYITMGVAGLFILYLPEIVKAGKLYKVYSPLYKIEEKDHPYAANKSELAEIYVKKIIKKYAIIGYNKSQLSEFIYDVIDYRDDLIEIGNHYRIDKYLIEIVAASLVTRGYVRSRKDYDDLNKLSEDQMFIKELMYSVQMRYPETKFTNNTIEGNISGRFCILKIDDLFVRKIAPFIEIYKTYGWNLAVVNKKDKDKEKIMTIGEYLDMTYPLTPKILSRYKGLGEMNPSEIKETVMNPNNRTMVRLTTEDCERDLEIFKKLMSDKAEYKRLRKKMMEEYHIDPEYIDN